MKLQVATRDKAMSFMQSSRLHDLIAQHYANIHNFELSDHVYLKDDIEHPVLWAQTTRFFAALKLRLLLG